MLTLIVLHAYLQGYALVQLGPLTPLECGALVAQAGPGDAATCTTQAPKAAGCTMDGYGYFTELGPRHWTAPRGTPELPDAPPMRIKYTCHY